jgi:hypothetical protein
MGKLKRGGYVFVAWSGDHPPRHVHVYRDGRLVVKYNLDRLVVIKGKMPPGLERIIRALVQEGRI